MGRLFVANKFGQRVAQTTLNPNGIFLVSDTWTVPSNVNTIWLTACAAGSGGAGGNSTPGGGGGGGANGASLYERELTVTPNSLLTITLGTPGLGGAVNTIGGLGTNTVISGFPNFPPFTIYAANVAATAGLAVNGGTGGGFTTPVNALAGGAGGVGSNGSQGALLTSPAATQIGDWIIASGSGGGALNFKGGICFNAGNLSRYLYAINIGAAGGAAGGGGGIGGANWYGYGAFGGVNGLPGANATAYGTGGGGGSGNSAGGNGGNAMAIIRY